MTIKDKKLSQQKHHGSEHASCSPLLAKRSTGRTQTTGGWLAWFTLIIKEKSPQAAEFVHAWALALPLFEESAHESMEPQRPR